MGSGRLENSRPRQLTLRRFRKTDALATFNVFYDAVHHGTGAHYSDRDRAAWAASDQPSDGWADRMNTQITHVAETEGRIIGFMSLRDDGYLDMAFVLPHVMGTGVSDRLYEAQESAALSLKLTTLTTDASHLARPFFLRHGWTVLASQTSRTNGHDIENFAMQKLLSGA